MKVCFLQKQKFAYLGVMAVSSALKNKGHETDVLIDSCENDLEKSVRAVGPDVVGFSVLSTEHGWLQKTVGTVKRLMPSVPVVVGGVHAILYPEDVLAIDGVDYVCNGEGELAFPALLDRIGAGKNTAEGIDGIGYKKDGKIFLQGATALMGDLDSITEDRSVYYDRYHVLRDLPLKYFSSSRGCPFKCTFCANRHFIETYKGKGRYIRRKSPAHLVEEIRHVKSAYGLSSVVFADDLFVSNLKWLEEFSPLYRSEIGVKYFCTARAGTVRQRHAELLAGSGCHTVSMGVETGSESLRREILNKKVTDEDIAETAVLVKRSGMKLQTSNMFCLPGETFEDAVSTVDLNIRIGADFMFSLIFLPYPKSELADHCIKSGMLKEGFSFLDMPESFITGSVLDLEDKERIENVQKVSYLCLRFPALRGSLIRLAQGLRARRLFMLAYLVGTFLRYKDEKNLGFFQALRFLWTFRKGY